MRDITERRFVSAARYHGFGGELRATAEGLRFVADDGLRIEPVLVPGTVRLDRRQTLARMAKVRKRRPYHPENSEATGASTPMASMTAAPSQGA